VLSCEISEQKPKAQRGKANGRTGERGGRKKKVSFFFKNHSKCNNNPSSQHT